MGVPGAGVPGVLVPGYLGLADHPWLAGLLEERDRFVGRPQREWAERLTEPFPWPAPRRKLRLAVSVLDRAAAPAPRPAVAAARIRESVFVEAARGGARAEILARAAATLGLSPELAEASLFADLQPERLLRAPDGVSSAAELAVRTNGALVATLLKAATRVELTLRGQSRAVVRHALLLGLLCTPYSLGESDAVRLELSGPLALFRHTVVYGRVLASLVPRLGWCNEYELVADCRLTRDRPLARVRIRSGDPLPVARELPRHDSRLERRFERDLGRLAPEWEIVREPAPLRAGDQLVFPDFELRHRHHRDRRWYVEIVGYWSRDYLDRKLMQLRRAGIERLVVCIDEARSVATETALEHAHVVRFRRRVDPAAVLLAMGPG